MAKLRDVAKAANVSLAVASRALTGDAKARVSPATRERVLEAARKLNYTPNHRARALRLSQAGAIALVVPSASNVIFADLFGGVNDACQQEDVSIFLCEICEPDDVDTQLGRTVGHGRVDAVLLQRSELFDDEALARLIDVQIPVMLVNCTLPGRVGSLALDDRAGVAIALEHLIGLGHERIGFIGGAALHDAAARRRSAFLDIAGDMTESGWMVDAGWEAPEGAAALDRILGASTMRPTAVLAASANSAVGALARARELGISVPDDLSIMCVQDTWVCSYTDPPLTTVAMPLQELGHAAATMLLAHIDGKGLESTVLTDPAPKLVVRASTAPPSV